MKTLCKLQQQDLVETVASLFFSACVCSYRSHHKMICCLGTFFKWALLNLTSSKQFCVTAISFNALTLSRRSVRVGLTCEVISAETVTKKKTCCGFQFPYLLRTKWFQIVCVRPKNYWNRQSIRILSQIVVGIHVVRFFDLHGCGEGSSDTSLVCKDLIPNLPLLSSIYNTTADQTVEKLLATKVSESSGNPRVEKTRSVATTCR